MAKIRIYELAKELGAENKELVKEIKRLGIEIKGVMSTLTDDEAARVRRMHGKGGGASPTARPKPASARPIRRRRPAKPRPPRSLLRAPCCRSASTWALRKRSRSSSE